MTEALEERHGALVALCEQYGVKRLDVFGSALRDDFSPGESDVDLLVEFQAMEPYARVDAYFGLLEGSRLLFNADIDLVMAGAVKNRYIAAEIDRTRQTVYAA